MSANAMSEDRAAAMATGISDYLTKPFDIARVFEVLARWLKKPHPLSRLSDPKPPSQQK